MHGKWLAGAALALLAPAAMAGLFKCGAVYQDRPCDNGQPQQQLRPSGGTMSAPPVVTVNNPKTAPAAPAKGLGCMESAEIAVSMAPDAPNA